MHHNVYFPEHDTRNISLIAYQILFGVTKDNLMVLKIFEPILKTHLKEPKVKM